MTPTNDIHPTVTSSAPSTKETKAPQANNINGANTANHHPLPATAITLTPTPLQIAIAAILLGTSAGLTLYTKKTSSMLQRMERMNANAVQRRGPEKFGPTTKSEWEKMRNRWGGKDDDDIV